MSLAPARAVARQIDVVEFLESNRATLATVTAGRKKLERGVLDYIRDAISFVRDTRQGREAAKAQQAEASAAAEAEAALNATKSPAEQAMRKERKWTAMEQYEESQELLRKMKWKRFTWDDSADYDSFARRVMDNDAIFANVPAMSFLSLHLVHDPANTTAAAPATRNIRDIQKGTLSSWLLDDAITQPAAPPARTTAITRQPFKVDWVGGEAQLLDSASAQEILTFLESEAQRLQALQVRMEAENEKIMEDIDVLRWRMRAAGLVFNSHNRTFWDDADRKGNPDYVNPADMRKFLDSAARRATLLRKYLRGNHVRVVPAGQPYRMDAVKNEICIPANFEDFNWKSVHDRYETIESFKNANRRVHMLWFLLAVLMVGDFELL